MIFVIYRVIRRLVRELAGRITIILVAFAGLLLVAGAIFSYVEYRGLWEGVYWAFVTATTIGYGDIYPETWLGRVVAVATAVAGIALFTALIGVVADHFAAKAARAERGELPVREKGHIVIMGWTRHTERLVEELRANLSDKHIVLLNTDGPVIRTASITTVRGDPTRTKDQLKASTDKAWAIVVSTGDDSKTILAVLHARRLNPQALIVAEALEEENIDPIRQAGADRVVYTGGLGGDLLASAVFEPSVPRLIADLASSVEGIADLVEEPATSYAGKTFLEALVEAKKTEDKLLVAVVKHDGMIIASPPPDYRIEDGDKLIVLVKSHREKSS
ncbi:Calcium-gated potassium channel [Hyperthermus butylicus DSM 5456]|uniref:Calcium-gated potassium channel n=1 Tax=Hyperthermus butylicus (strain DSM 5456 / JCM 9403 / PLM1-5) TaxID=415426 RepID=A2BKG9_HYPBU|nr:Calcium-gated potassium channel [Hyperthermus butylicus DSM 5456]